MEINHSNLIRSIDYKKGKVVVTVPPIVAVPTNNRQKSHKMNTIIAAANESNAVLERLQFSPGFSSSLKSRVLNIQ